MNQKMNSKLFPKLDIRVIQILLPWLILICGIPAVICFSVCDFARFEVFYKLGMLTGLFSMIAELAIGVACLISAIVSAITKKNGKYSIAAKIGIWLYSLVCIVGTALLMLLLQGFTYGQGV